MLVLVVAMIFSSGCATNKNKLPTDATEALHTAKNITLFSLEPWGLINTNDDLLHGFKILGQTTLDEKQTAIAVNAFESAICQKERRFTLACFDPRHAIQVIDKNRTYDFLLCYACGYLYVYRDNEFDASLEAFGSPEELNALLVVAKIPLSKSDNQ